MVSSFKIVGNSLSASIAASVSRPVPSDSEAATFFRGGPCLSPHMRRSDQNKTPAPAFLFTCAGLTRIRRQHRPFFTCAGQTGMRRRHRPFFTCAGQTGMRRRRLYAFTAPKFPYPDVPPGICRAQYRSSCAHPFCALCPVCARQWREAGVRFQTENRFRRGCRQAVPPVP